MQDGSRVQGGPSSSDVPARVPACAYVCALCVCVCVCVHKLMHVYHVDALSNAERVDQARRSCALYSLYVSRVECNHGVQGNVNTRGIISFLPFVPIK